MLASLDGTPIVHITKDNLQTALDALPYDATIEAEIVDRREGPQGGDGTQGEPGGRCRQQGLQVRVRLDLGAVLRKAANVDAGDWRQLRHHRDGSEHVDEPGPPIIARRGFDHPRLAPGH